MNYKEFIKLSKEQQKIYWEMAKAQYLEKTQKETAKRGNA
jgi:hypothetical protein